MKLKQAFNLIIDKLEEDGYKDVVNYAIDAGEKRYASSAEVDVEILVLDVLADLCRIPTISQTMVLKERNSKLSIPGRFIELIVSGINEDPETIKDVCKL